MHADSNPPAHMSAGFGDFPSPEDFRHDPVLLPEVLSCVPARPVKLVDCTLGGGGHAEALLERFPGAVLFGCDRDPQAIAAAEERLRRFGERALLKHLSFSQVSRHLLANATDFMLADLGVSSPQLERGARGFSFSEDGPLDMRMDPSGGGCTAAELVNRAREEELVSLMRRFGEERFAPRIARAILAARAQGPIASTGALAQIVSAAVPARFQRRGFHPATRVFQALRIAVNDELGELERLLDAALPLLAPGGRLVVISFHSLEDRPVKERFRRWESPCDCPPSLPVCICGKTSQGRRLTRKPVTPSGEEVARNPRSRSAKLRAFEKAPLGNGATELESDDPMRGGLLPGGSTAPGGGGRER